MNGQKIDCLFINICIMQIQERYIHYQQHELSVLTLFMIPLMPKIETTKINLENYKQCKNRMYTSKLSFLSVRHKI